MSELKLTEDFNDEDLFREVFNKGYDAGYERGIADETVSARTLVRRLMAKYDDVLDIDDVIAELDAMERGEVTIETVCESLEGE